MSGQDPRSAPNRALDLQAAMARARALAREAAAPIRSPSPKAARPPRVWPLWLLSTPLLLGAVSALATGRFSGFLGDALGWGLIAGAAVLTRQGATDQGARWEQRFSRGWRLPPRTLAAAALGLGTAVAATGGVGHGVPVGIAFGALAVLGYHLVYGLEPLRVGPRLAGGDKEARAVADALAEAEGRLINIERAASAIGNLELSQRLSRIAHQGRGMLEQIAERPSDLRRARRFLTVFLEGAEQVSDGYVRTHHHAESPELEQSFRNVLVSIEDQLIRQRERLRQADVLDLDVQIEVLKKQLEQEGIR